MGSPSRRHSDFADFVLRQLPDARVRVLEVGCGDGEVALALARAGCLVTAIDPRAPEGPIFRQVRLEDFDGEGGFAAVIASVALHHVHDLGGAVDRIADLLAPAGLLILDEFDRERLRGATARWYHEERRRRDETVPDDWQTWLREWHEEHGDIHSAAELRRELGRRFVERSFEWRPYLFSYALGDELEPAERALIESGEIDAVGFRWVGERRA
jgi:SAM-dependent methyltransferase